MEKSRIPFQPVIRDIEFLHPIMRGPLSRFIEKLREYNESSHLTDFPDADGVIHRHTVHIFETYRTPIRQQYLFTGGAEGRKVTNAEAYRSSHQFGLAFDLAARRHETTNASSPAMEWTWDHIHWGLIRMYAEHAGFRVPQPENDPGHIEHPIWVTIRDAIKKGEGR